MIKIIIFNNGLYSKKYTKIKKKIRLIISLVFFKCISFKWDNSGNLLKDDKATYSYDEFNRITKVETFDGNVQINRYDAEGLRYQMEENGQLVQFIFNTEREVIAEKENEWTVYIRGSELLASSNDYAKMYYQYATDEMGSITHIVDDKEILNYYEYDAWVNIVEQKETVKNRFKFNGQQLAPITQQYYLRARFYNPVIARFTQEDIYREDGLNLYTYCRNNPIYRVEAIKSISYIKLFAIFSLNSKNGLSSKLYRKMSLVEYHKILKINQLQLQIKGSGSSKWLSQSLDKVK